MGRPLREALVSLAFGLGATALISAGLCAACQVTGVDFRVLALAAVAGCGLSVVAFILIPEWISARRAVSEPEPTETGVEHLT